jgi:hypothetical protein
MTYCTCTVTTEKSVIQDYMEVSCFVQNRWGSFSETFSQKQMTQSQQAENKCVLFFPCRTVQFKNFEKTYFIGFDSCPPDHRLLPSRSQL